MYRYVDAGMLRLAARPSDPPIPCPDLDGVGADAVHDRLRWLRDVWSDDWFHAAVELASPALAARTRTLIDAIDPCPRSVRRACASTLRYLLRSRSRATPFGLFAGIAPLRVADSARVGVDHVSRAVARVDHRWLISAVECLLGDPGVAERTTTTVDGRAFVRGGWLVLPAPGDVPARAQLPEATPPAEVSVRLTPAVVAVLDRAAQPTALSRLRKDLADEFPTAGADEVDRLLTELRTHGFLTTGLHPPMTCRDPLGHVIDTASAAADCEPDSSTVLTELRAIHDLLVRHDATPDAVGMRGRKLRRAVTVRMRAVADHDTPLGVDLHVDTEVAVPSLVVAEATAAAAALVRLAPELSGHAAWGDYHRRFLDRHGTGAVVPVVDLLHGGDGLGYPAGYRDTCLPAAAPRDDTASRRRHTLLTSLVHAATWDRVGEIELTDTELDSLGVGADVAPQPHTELRVEVHAPTTAAIDAGRFHLLVVGASRAAGTVTGRFLDVLAPHERKRMVAVLRDLPTADDGAARVQLSGPPLNQAAGTISRSIQVLPAEVTVGGHARSGSLRPADLAVSADTAGLYLMVGATGEPVEPILFAALELVHGAHPTLRFLAEIATSACAPCGPFVWDPQLRDLPHLPRVRYRRTVLTPARWSLQVGDVESGPDAWRSWRDRWTVPDRVVWAQHDRRLRLDLTEPAHRHLLAGALSRYGRLTLLEAPTPDAFDWIDGRAHELVLPLAATTRRRPPARPRPTAAAAGGARADRPRARLHHIPAASNWLDARLTCRPHHQTSVLVDHLPALLAELALVVDVSATWFLRLVRPDHHLRLRVRLIAADRFDAAAARLATWAGRLIDAGLLGDLQLGTYRPETSRFGNGAALDAVETVFAADSAAAAAQLRLATTAIAGADQAVTAASLLDIATGFSMTPDAGRTWLLRCAPRAAATPASRIDRTRTIALTGPDHRVITAIAGGTDVLAAWERRRLALSAYRAALAEVGISPDTVLPDLLHLHHARVHGPHLDRESVCLHLARVAALSQQSRAGRTGPAS